MRMACSECLGNAPAHRAADDSDIVPGKVRQQVRDILAKALNAIGTCRLIAFAMTSAIDADNVSVSFQVLDHAVPYTGVQCQRMDEDDAWLAGLSIASIGDAGTVGGVPVFDG